MNPPKYELGQQVHVRVRPEERYIVKGIENFGDGWSYRLENGGKWASYLEGGLLADGEQAPPPDPLTLIDLSSLERWLREQYKILPPEEGNGYQPTVDLLNHVTEHRNGLVGAVQEYCEKVGLDDPFRRRG